MLSRVSSSMAAGTVENTQKINAITTLYENTYSTFMYVGSRGSKLCSRTYSMCKARWVGIRIESNCLAMFSLISRTWDWEHFWRFFYQLFPQLQRPLSCAVMAAPSGTINFTFRSPTRTNISSEFVNQRGSVGGASNLLNRPLLYTSVMIIISIAVMPTPGDIELIKAQIAK